MGGSLGKHREKTGLGMRIRAIGMRLIYCESLTDAHPPLFLVPLADFLLRDPSRFSAPTFFCSISTIGHLQHAMIPTQVRCRGCDKIFTPRALSQHASKTQNVRCCTIINLPLDQFGPPSILCTASHLPSADHMPGVISNSHPGDEYRCPSDQALDDAPNMDDVSSGGASFMAHVSKQGSIFHLVLRSDMACLQLTRLRN